MTVCPRDNQAGLGDPLFRADNMQDTPVRIVRAEQPCPILFRVGADDLDHLGDGRVRLCPVLPGCDIMLGKIENLTGIADFMAIAPQIIEGVE